jgi:chromosome segregation ATPase
MLLNLLIKNKLIIKFTIRNLHFDKNAENIDVILDIKNLQKNLQKILQEKQELEIIIKNFQIENEEIKNINQELNEKKMKIINSLELGINELEESKNKINFLQDEKNNIQNELNKIKEFKAKLILDYDDILQKNKDFEKITIDYENLKIENEEGKKEIKRLNDGKIFYFILFYFIIFNLI